MEKMNDRRKEQRRDYAKRKRIEASILQRKYLSPSKMDLKEISQELDLTEEIVERIMNDNQ